MRFGKTLRNSIYEPWKQYYIDYTKLKQLLREDDSGNNTDEWTDKDEETFFDELINNQFEKVKNFHREVYQKLRDRTSKCEQKLEPVANSVNGPQENGEDNTKAAGNGKKPLPSEDEGKKIMKEVRDELDNITKETNELEKFSRVNYTGFLKIAKKHDRKRGATHAVRGPVQSYLASAPFNKEDYSPLLYRLSAMYSFIRQYLDDVNPRKSMAFSEISLGGESHTSHKFWVHPDNLLEVKTVILRRLPVLVYNPQTSKVAEGGQPDPTITSIYFDDPSFSLYSNKVENPGDASSLRLRWYGKLSQKPDIMFEKKTVKEDDTSEEERFPIKDKYIEPFMSGGYKMAKSINKLQDRHGEDSDQVVEFKKNVDDIQTFIKEKKLQPVLRANYKRTAFQIPGDDRIRISLDTNLAFIREDAIDVDRPCRDPVDWHRKDIDDAELEYPFNSIRKGEIQRFPFALLEIKVKNQKHYEWVQDLINSHLVHPTPRFSKFVQGVASLFEDYVNTFPFWLADLESDIRKEPTKAFEEEQEKKRKQQEDDFAVGSLMKSLGSPANRGSRMSPVGSPSISNVKPSPITGGDFKRRQSWRQSAATTAEPTGIDNVAEEADSDDDGPQGHGQEVEGATSQSGLRSLFPSFSTSKYARRRRERDVALPPGVQKPAYWIKDQGPVKVEAKVWLANQRTFIKWQHVSVLLGTLGLGLYNAAGVDNNVARALALVYTLIAIFTAAWGYGIYIWRSKLIESRSGKDFDQVLGPVVVCVGLVVALCLNFGFKVSR